MAAARNLWWKLLAILVLLVLVEYGLYCYADRVLQSQSETDILLSFSAIVEETHLKLVFLTAFLALTACCCLQGSRFSGKNLYLLQRLPTAEWKVTLLWAVIHLVCFLILWAVQLLMVFVLWKIYLTDYPSAAPGLQLLVFFYDNGFLHAMMPLRDISRWAVLLLYWPCMGWLTASFGFFQRRGQIIAGLLIPLGGYFVLTSGLGNNASCWIFIVVFLLTVAGNVHRMWEVYHDKATN